MKRMSIRRQKKFKRTIHRRRKEKKNRQITGASFFPSVEAQALLSEFEGDIASDICASRDDDTISTEERKDKQKEERRKM